MDQRPFLELNLLDVREDRVAEVRKLSKESFDLEHILSTAGELKHLREISRILNEQVDSPRSLPPSFRYHHPRLLPPFRLLLLRLPPLARLALGLHAQGLF